MEEARNFTFTSAIRLLSLKLAGQGNEEACNSIFHSDNAAGRTLYLIGSPYEII